MTDRADTAPSIRKRWLGFAAFVIIAAIIGIGLWLSRQPGPAQVQAMVDADEIIVSAKVAGRIDQLFVAEGDRVAAGQRLHTLTGPEIAAKRAQAEAVIAAAQAQSAKAQNGARAEEIEAARANAARAEAGAALAETTYQRTQNLFVEGVVAAQRRDEALANFKSSREAAAARAQSAQARAGARQEDIAAVAAQVRQAQAALAEVAAAEAETRIAAPLAAVVTRKMVDVGELVPAGYLVFTLTDIDHAFVALNLREDQLRGVKSGAIIGVYPLCIRRTDAVYDGA